MNKPMIGIGWQTASDESTLFTDADSLRSFAKSLLDIADTLENQKDVQVTHRILHPLSEVRIDWVSLVQNEEELITRIQEHQ
ncbi:MAG: hypothetical protein SynsKO_40980 [Synoicihabitans sp.]